MHQKLKFRDQSAKKKKKKKLRPKCNYKYSTGAREAKIP